MHLGKAGTNFFLPLTMGKYEGRSGSLALVSHSVKVKEKLTSNQIYLA